MFSRARRSRTSRAFDVDPGVVGDHAFRDDPVTGEVAERAREKTGDRRCALVGVDLGVGEPCVVLDDRVHVVDPVTTLALLASAVTGDAVSGPLEARVLAGVHVQQITRTRHS